PWSDVFPPERLELVYQLKHDPEEFTDPERVLRDSVDRILRRRLEDRREAHKRQLAQAATDEEKMKQLSEIYRINQALRTLSTSAREVPAR
ncbi:MAG: hypothetical protein ACREKI_03665, partial [Gemmatimonadota bacterium]